MQKYEDGVDHEPQQDKRGWPKPEVQALRLAAFCAWMQNGSGLITKSPSYILEKWNAISRGDTVEHMVADMDLETLSRFHKWFDAWRDLK